MVELIAQDLILHIPKDHQDLASLKQEIPAFRRLIFDLHVIKGHLNFPEIFREFQEGHYDSDIWLKEIVTIYKLSAYKQLS